MAYKITDKCISCGACAASCPVSCISQGDDKYIINKGNYVINTYLYYISKMDKIVKYKNLTYY